MNIQKILVASATAALLSASVASAKDTVAKGFLTLRLDDKGKVTMELPKELLGREMIMSSAVEKISNGGEAIVGYRSQKPIQFCFTATDSLILFNELDAVRYTAKEENARKAVRSSHIGNITATFPIDFESRDSSFYKIDVTSLFEKYDKRLTPNDPLGADSFGGLVQSKLRYKSELSAICGVEAFATNVSVLSKDTFEAERTVLGMKSGNPEELITAVVRRSITLLPEEPMRPRIADPRIGVNYTEGVVFGSDDRGSKSTYYARRWRLEPGQEIVFYLDTLFNDRMAKAITDGVLAWNDAFEGMGMGKVLKVLPYPAKDSTFNANDIARSCIKYETMQNTDVRNSFCTDPRTGEIISASIYVPFDVISAIHAKMMLEISLAEPSLRTSQNTADILYEGLQAKVTYNVGECLGLVMNQAASTAVTIDQLLDPKFTNEIGLSGSIMDRLPYNYLATEKDVKAGVKLVQTKIGPYDKYAINWLYGQVPGAVTPEDEKPYLNDLILASKHDPLCRFLRTYGMRDARYSLDPRVNPWDLGNDPIEVAKIRIRNSKEIISHLHEWLNGTDPRYTFRPMLNGEFIYAYTFTYRNILDLAGGLLIADPHEGEEEPGFKQIPAEVQRKALEYVLDEIDDVSWMDNDALYRDIFFVRSIADYVVDGLYQDVFIALSKIAFVESICDNVEFTLEDAFDVIIDHVLKNVKEGREEAINSRRMQYMLVSFSLQNAHALKDYSEIAEAYEAGVDARLKGGEIGGFEPLAAVSHSVPLVQDHRIYAGLKKIRDIYAKGVKKAPTEKLKDDYKYIVMAIDRVLKDE